MCYSLWYNAPTMLPEGSLEAEELRFRLPAATSWVHYTTSCKTQSSAPEDGRNNRPKHVKLIGIINKLLLLHLVGCFYYYEHSDVIRSLILSDEVTFDLFTCVNELNYTISNREFLKKSMPYHPS